MVQKALPLILARIKPAFPQVNYAQPGDISAATAADECERVLEEADAAESRRLDRHKRSVNLAENSDWAKFLWAAD